MGAELFETRLRSSLEERQKSPEVTGLRRRHAASVNKDESKEVFTSAEPEVGAACDAVAVPLDACLPAVDAPCPSPLLDLAVRLKVTHRHGSPSTMAGNPPGPPWPSCR